MEAVVKARAKAKASSTRKKSKATLKVGPEAKRLKASPGSSLSASMSEEPESRAQILTPFTVDIASGNVNYAAVVAGASHETADVK